MSDLLNKASLVVIPSGYKEDTVYSVVPSDGSGDLSFTRASNGTRINSAGLVEVCPWNLLQQSENYSVSPWSRSFVTVTPNDIVAPNGTLTGNKIVLNNSGSQRYQISQNLTTNTTLPMTYTFYAKKNQIDVFVGVIGGASGMSYEVQFNLTNVTATEVYNSSAINTAKSIESVGNDWYKCTITAGSSAGNINGVNIFKDTTGNGTDSFYIWGCQLNIGSTAKPYFPTTDRLNVPRLTYQNGGGGCPSLLLEKQSTNLVTYSEDFSNAAWTKFNASVTANDTTSPDGTQNADKLIENTANDEHVVYRAIDGTSKTFSFYAKAAGRNWLAVLSNNGTYTYFNVSNGTLGTIAATSTATIEDAGNGWYRCTVYNTHATYGAVMNLATANGTVVYTGNGTSGVYLWGAQAEISTYPTSYIPTTSASATRVADDYSRSLSSIASGTAFINITDNVAVGTPGTHVFGPFGITGASLGLYLSRPNNARLRLWTAAANNVFQTTETNLKLAITWDGTNVNVYQNGVKVVTNYSYAITNVNNLFSSTAIESSATIAEIVLFNSVLTDAECIALTT